MLAETDPQPAIAEVTTASLQRGREQMLAETAPPLSVQ
jgi:hypothetical protein